MTTETRWRKSSRSAHEGGQCVEVADLTGVVGVRDSKDVDGPRIVLTVGDWRNLTRRIRDVA
ncbi:DUF397 domain-containing protein [Spirillospora sp. NPDC052269]